VVLLADAALVGVLSPEKLRPRTTTTLDPTVLSVTRLAEGR